MVANNPQNSQSADRLLSFHVNVRSRINATLYNEFYALKVRSPLELTADQNEQLERLSSQISNEVSKLFKSFNDAYDNEIRKICLGFAVQTVSVSNEYHTPQSILQRAKVFEQYIYGELPVDDKEKTDGK